MIRVCLATGGLLLTLGGTALGGAVTEEVVFASRADGVSLGGILTLPESEGPHCGVIVIGASGEHPGSEARTGGQHWAALGEHLADAGIATLTLDNRGVGHTLVEGAEGWTYEWTSEDLLPDAHAALDWMRQHPGIDATRIGLIGHSDGAWRAALLAGQRPDHVAFLIALSPAGVRGADNLIESQLARVGIENPAAEEAARRSLREALELVIAGDDREAAVGATADALGHIGVPEDNRQQVAERTVGGLWIAGVQEALGANPAEAFGTVRCPAAALWGTVDNRQPVALNIAGLGGVMGAHARFDAMVFPGLGHFLESPDTPEGAPPVFAPEVVEAIERWVALRCAR